MTFSEAFYEKAGNGIRAGAQRLVDGKMKVRYMDREHPDNVGLYDVNTIAAIDPDIVPFLNSPAGSAFEREDMANPFVVSE